MREALEHLRDTTPLAALPAIPAATAGAAAGVATGSASLGDKIPAPGAGGFMVSREVQKWLYDELAKRLSAENDRMITGGGT